MSNNGNGDDIIKDMSLLDKEKETKKFDMSLESPASSDLEARIKKSFPEDNIIRIDEKTEILKMASGNYRLNDTEIKDLNSTELNRIDLFLKSKEGAA